MLLPLFQMSSHSVGEHSFLGPVGVLYSYILIFWFCLFVCWLNEATLDHQMQFKIRQHHNWGSIFSSGLIVEWFLK